MMKLAMVEQTERTAMDILTGVYIISILLITLFAIMLCTPEDR